MLGSIYENKSLSWGKVIPHLGEISILRIFIRNMRVSDVFAEWSSCYFDLYDVELEQLVLQFKVLV